MYEVIIEYLDRDNNHEIEIETVKSKRAAEKLKDKYEENIYEMQRKYPDIYTIDKIYTRKVAAHGIPICPKCNRPVRPDVVLYGEKLPMDTLYKATTAISKADCLIVGGTSLQVWPAAGIVSYFKGDYMVVINKDHLPIELGDGDLQINDSLGNVFREIKKYI